MIELFNNGKELDKVHIAEHRKKPLMELLKYFQHRLSNHFRFTFNNELSVAVKDSKKIKNQKRY